jgi:hypothetical protein
VIPGAVACVAALPLLSGCGSSDARPGGGNASGILVDPVRLENAGNIAATLPNITSSTGSFPCAFVAAGETDSTGRPDSFSLQLNTDPNRQVALCNGRPGCKGTLQFTFQTGAASNGDGIVFVQYALTNYGRPCPTILPGPGGYWQEEGTADCYGFSQPTVVPIIQTAQDLAHLALTGTVSGGQCQASLNTGSGSPITSTGSDLFQLEGSWTASEFNVRGPTGGLQAVFVPSRPSLSGNS